MKNDERSKRKKKRALLERKKKLGRGSYCTRQQTLHMISSVAGANMSPPLLGAVDGAPRGKMFCAGPKLPPAIAA
jgi:hypothetical protein